jgi:hypothetical protein
VPTCISNPRISPLVIGRSTSFFKGSKGSHQGCPLSSLLYIIMVESLNRKLKVERSFGNLLRIRVVRGVKSINHFKFFDDTLLLSGVS